MNGCRCGNNCWKYYYNLIPNPLNTFRCQQNIKFQYRSRRSYRNWTLSLCRCRHRINSRYPHWLITKCRLIKSNNLRKEIRVTIAIFNKIIIRRNHMCKWNSNHDRLWQISLSLWLNIPIVISGIPFGYGIFCTCNWYMQSQRLPFFLHLVFARKAFKDHDHSIDRNYNNALFKMYLYILCWPALNDGTAINTQLNFRTLCLDTLTLQLCRAQIVNNI